jgi:hypothetical protein
MAVFPDRVARFCSLVEVQNRPCATPLHFSPSHSALPHAFGAVEWPTSQPLFGLPSQVSYPVLHPTSWQAPVEHDAVALALLHGTSHPAQSVRVVIDRSQPLLGLESQLM